MQPADDVAKLQDLVEEARAAGLLLRDLEADATATGNSRSPSRDSSPSRSADRESRDRDAAGRTLVQVLAEDRDRWMHRAKGLSARVELLLQERADVAAVAAQSEQDCGVVGDELRVSQQRLASLQREYSDSAMVIASLRTDVASLRHRGQSTSEECGRLQGRLDERDMQLQRVQTQLETSNAAVAAADTRAMDLTTRVHELEAVVSATALLPPPDARLVNRSELQLALERADAADCRVGELEAALEVAKARAAAAEERATRKATRIATVAASDATLETARQLAHATALLDELRAHKAIGCTDAEAQATDGAEEAESDDTLVARLDRELDDARLHISALNRALEQSVAREYELEAQMRELDSVAAAASPAGSPQRATPLRPGSPSSPERDSRALGEMRRTVVAWRDAAAKAQVQAAEEKDAREASAAHLIDVRRTLLETEQRCGMMEDQARRTTADREAHQNTITKLRSNVDALTAEVSEVRGSNAELQRRCAAFEHAALHAIEGVGSLQFATASNFAEVLQWQVASRRCVQVLQAAVPQGQADAIVASLKSSPTDSDATEELTMQLMQAALAAAACLRNQGGMIDAMGEEATHLRRELDAWHALFPAAAGDGPESNDVTHEGGAAGLERAEVCIADRERLLQQLSREQCLRHSIADNLSSTQADLKAAQERVAGLAPQQNEFFTKQRPLLLRHLYQTVRALRPAKQLLERSAETSPPPGPSPPSSLEQNAAHEDEERREELLAAAQTVASIRRRADWLLMKCFTSHERSEVDTSDLSLLAGGFDGDDMSSIARSPSVMTRHSAANESGSGVVRHYRA